MGIRHSNPTDNVPIREQLHVLQKSQLANYVNLITAAISIKGALYFQK